MYETSNVKYYIQWNEVMKCHIAIHMHKNRGRVTVAI